MTHGPLTQHIIIVIDWLANKAIKIFSPIIQNSPVIPASFIALRDQNHIINVINDKVAWEGPFPPPNLSEKHPPPEGKISTPKKRGLIGN